MSLKNWAHGYIPLTNYRSRKIDFRIIPFLSVVYGLSLLDRSNISAAYIAGMDEALDLTVGES